ncbi:MAG: c-type cytochrome [Myxococcaceae bacterium]
MRSRAAVVFVVTLLGVSFSTGCSNGPSSPGGTGGGDAGSSGGAGAGEGCLSVPLDDTPVLTAPKSPPPVSGGTMVVMSSGLVAIGDSDRDEVHFVDSNWAATHVQLQERDEPGRIVEGPAGSVFVALRGTHEVAQVDATTLSVSRYDACPAPRGLAWRADSMRLLVACPDGELVTLDFSQPGPPVRSAVQVAGDLRDVLISHGQVLVTTFRAPQVFAVAADGTVTPWSEPVAVSNGMLNFVPRVGYRTIATQGGLVMVHQVEETTAIPAATACVSPYGDSGGEPPVVPVVSVLSEGNAAPLGRLPNEALPIDVAVTSDGSGAAVVMFGSRTVHVMSPGQPGVFFPLKLDSEPVAVAYTGNPAHPTLLVFSREPAQLTAFDDQRQVIAPVSLSPVSMASTGHLLFHRQTAGGIACASCHPEAGDDGHVWNLPAGMRRTPSLRGGLKGTEPFHWNGEEPDMSTLVTDVLVARMGGNPEPAANTSALLDWMDAQPKRPSPGNLDAAAVARGEASFAALGCNSCHAGAAGTDNRYADVGTGESLQVPRLVELAYRAPFFHDGRIATLADRFTKAGGSAHTGISGLSAAQISDLVAYLQSR